MSKDKEIFMAGFNRALAMVRDEEDIYGIGNMCSQWTGADVADDMKNRIEEELRHTPINIYLED